MAQEPKLPTKEELAELPRWAVVAYAARCAERVLPLFPKTGPLAKRWLAVERAVTVASEGARSAFVVGAVAVAASGAEHGHAL